MHVGNIDMLDEVLITCSTSLHSYSTSILSLVLSKRCSLDISEMRNCNYNILISIEVLWVEFLCRKCNLGSSLITVFLLHLKSFILDDTHLKVNVCKNILTILDELHKLVVLVLELLSFESGELTESHFYNRCSLSL